MIFALQTTPRAGQLMGIGWFSLSQQQGGKISIIQENGKVFTKKIHYSVSMQPDKKLERSEDNTISTIGAPVFPAFFKILGHLCSNIGGTGGWSFQPPPLQANQTKPTHTGEEAQEAGGGECGDPRDRPPGPSTQGMHSGRRGKGKATYATQRH